MADCCESGNEALASIKWGGYGGGGWGLSVCGWRVLDLLSRNVLHGIHYGKVGL